jgi:hypothetical protein
VVKLFIALVAGVGLWNGVVMARTIARMRKALKDIKDEPNG